MTKLAVAGATGLVGRNMLDTIDRKGIQFDELQDLINTLMTEVPTLIVQIVMGI